MFHGCSWPPHGAGSGVGTGTISGVGAGGCTSVGTGPKAGGTSSGGVASVGAVVSVGASTGGASAASLAAASAASSAARFFRFSSSFAVFSCVFRIAASHLSKSELGTWNSIVKEFSFLKQLRTKLFSGDNHV